MDSLYFCVDSTVASAYITHKNSIGAGLRRSYLDRMPVASRSFLFL